MTTMLRPRDAARSIGVSVSTIWRMRRTDATFPQPFRVGRQAVAWSEDELLAWLESRRMPATTNEAAR